jgi:hypothetical protein
LPGKPFISAGTAIFGSTCSWPSDIAARGGPCYPYRAGFRLKRERQCLNRIAPIQDRKQPQIVCDSFDW